MARADFTILGQRYTVEQLELDLRDLARYAAWLLDGHVPADGKGSEEPTIVALRTLMQRDASGAYAIDGFGPGGIGGSTSGGDVSRPTETMAIAAADEAGHRVDPDAVHNLVLEAMTHIVEARNHLVAAASRSFLLGQWQDGKRVDANNVALCPACDDPMPFPRAGFDEKCYRSWDRAGRPDRFTWIRKRHAELEAKKAV